MIEKKPRGIARPRAPRDPNRRHSLCDSEHLVQHLLLILKRLFFSFSDDVNRHTNTRATLSAARRLRSFAFARDARADPDTSLRVPRRVPRRRRYAGQHHLETSSRRERASLGGHDTRDVQPRARNRDDAMRVHVRHRAATLRSSRYVRAPRRFARCESQFLGAATRPVTRRRRVDARSRVEGETSPRRFGVDREEDSSRVRGDGNRRGDENRRGSG